MFAQQKVLRESLIKRHICGATWRLLASAVRKQVRCWPVSQRGRRELCYSKARLSHWCRGTPQRGKMPAFVPARDHRITRREGDTDGQLIKKIASGDNKCTEKKWETEKPPEIRVWIQNCTLTRIIISIKNT